MEYVKSFRRGEDDGCVFCDALAAGDDAATYVVHRGPRCFVILNAYPYNTGHVLVLPNRHMDDVCDLTDEESLETMQLTQRLCGVFRDTMNAEGVNVGVNLGRSAGGSIDHLHWHVVPRWRGDTNFMPVVGGAKVLVEMLEDTWTRLRKAFANKTGDAT